MARIIALCGKICIGKSRYAQELAEIHRAVILSCDEITLGILGGNLGAQHDEIAARTQIHLMEKAVQIARAGANVILDFGFWTRASRDQARRFFSESGASVQWHFVFADDRTHRENIARRNHAASNQTPQHYFVDEGLLSKCNALFEEPLPDENMLAVNRSR